MARIIRCILLTLMLFVFYKAKAQANSKCQTVFDKELGIEVYKYVDSASKAVNQEEFENYFLSVSGKFKNITKSYPKNQMVRIGYMIGLDGKLSF